MQFEQVSYDGHVLKFKKPLNAIVTEESGYFMVGIPDTDYFAVEKTLTKAKRSFEELMIFLYYEYVLEDDDKLSPDAKELKVWLINIFE